MIAPADLSIALRQPGELTRRDADRVGLEPNEPTPGIDAVHATPQAEDAQQAVAEVLQVVMGVEGNRVGAEQTREQLGPARQQPEHVRRREGSVEEEGDLGVRGCFTNEAGQQHQVIVVDPDQIARLEVFQHHVAKPLVGLDVGIPVGRIELEPRRELVEQRPQGLVGIALVEAVVDLRGEIHLSAIVVAQPPGQHRVVLAVVVDGSFSRAADPQPVHLTHHRIEGTDQPTRVGHSPPRLADPPDRHR